MAARSTRTTAQQWRPWASHDGHYPHGYQPVEIYGTAPSGTVGRLNSFHGENMAVANEPDSGKAAALRARLAAQAHRNKQGWHGLFPQHAIEIRGL